MIAVSKEHPEAFDCGAELVVVIGRGGRNVAEAAALDPGPGGAVGPDFSARDRRLSEGQAGPGLAAGDRITTTSENLGVQEVALVWRRDAPKPRCCERRRGLGYRMP